jgi:hypothetical protein
MKAIVRNIPLNTPLPGSKYIFFDDAKASYVGKEITVDNTIGNADIDPKEKPNIFRWKYNEWCNKYFHRSWLIFKQQYTEKDYE